MITLLLRVSHEQPPNQIAVLDGVVRKVDGIQNHSIRRKQCPGMNCMRWDLLAGHL